MKDQQSISSGQMASLSISFLSGSAIVYIPKPLVAAAGNMAWLSLIIAIALGMLVLLCVLYLYRCYPELTLFEYAQQSVGKWMTMIMIIPFILMLFLMIPYIVVGIGSFFVSSMMIETPIYVFHALIILTSAMTVRAGIEVMARMFLMLLISMYGFIAIILLLSLPLYHPDQLLPLFPLGIKPVIHGIYFSFGFPFVEIVLFSMLLPYLRKEGRASVKKMMFGAMFISGIAFLLVILSTIMVLGPLAGERNYSLYAIARLIIIGNFLEGIEAVASFTLIAGSYMKATIVLFILNSLVSKLLKMDNNKLIIAIISFVCFLLSVTMFSKVSEYNEAVNVIWPLIMMTIGLIPILLITIVTYIRRLGKNEP